MRTLWILALSCATLSVARAEPDAPPDGTYLELGAGSPNILSGALAVKRGPWLGAIELGGIVGGMAAAGTAGVRLLREVASWNEWSLAVGPTASILGYTACCGEGAEGALALAGPVLELRRARALGRKYLAVQAGPMVGKCVGGTCGDSTYIAFALNARFGVLLRERRNASFTAPENRHRLSLTISPIGIALPRVSVTGEVRVLPKAGVAAVIGIGRNAQKDAVTALGSQLNYYPFGSFERGLLVGLGVDYHRGSWYLDRAMRGIAVGAYLGYKQATRSGFTYSVQAGAQRDFLRSDPSTPKVFPAGDLLAGWSF